MLPHLKIGGRILIMVITTRSSRKLRQTVRRTNRPTDTRDGQAGLQGGFIFNSVMHQNQLLIVSIKLESGFDSAGLGGGRG